MSSDLALSPDELAQVQAILEAHLPAGFRAYAFGSRARGKAKRWSDLDSAVEGPTPLPLPYLAALAEAFDDSPLAWKVDLIDCATVSARFREIVEADKRSHPPVYPSPR